MSYLDDGTSVWGEENSHIIQQLEWFIQEASETNALFPSILFIGQKGVGKTRLMNLVGNKVASIKGSDYVIRGPDSLKTEKDIQRVLSQIFQSGKHGEGVLGVDEIHNMRPRASDELGVYISATETGEFKFSVLGATTEPGKVKKPLESRMIKLAVANYSPNTLALIAKTSMPSLTEEAAIKLANITDQSPRYIIQQLLRPLKAYTHAHNIKIVDENVVSDWMKVRKLDKYGLTPEQRMYIRVFHNPLFIDRDKKIALSTIAARIEQSVDMTQIDIEKRLVQLNMVEIGKGGRSLTDFGYTYLREVQKMEEE